MRAPLVAPAPALSDAGCARPLAGPASTRLRQASKGEQQASPQPSSGLVFNRRDWTTIRPVLTGLAAVQAGPPIRSRRPPVLIAAGGPGAAALVIVGSLELLVEARGAERAGGRRWAVIRASAMEARHPWLTCRVEWLSQAAGPASAEEIDRRRSRRPRPGRLYCGELSRHPQ